MNIKLKKEVASIYYEMLKVLERSMYSIQNKERIWHKVRISHKARIDRILDHLGVQYMVSTSYMVCSHHILHHIPCRNIRRNLCILFLIRSYSSRILYILGSHNLVQMDHQCMECKEYKGRISPTLCNHRILHSCPVQELLPNKDLVNQKVKLVLCYIIYI